MKQSFFNGMLSHGQGLERNGSTGIFFSPQKRVGRHEFSPVMNFGVSTFTRKFHRHSPNSKRNLIFQPSSTHGGFKYEFFSSGSLGEWSNSTRIFLSGWFNHQLVILRGKLAVKFRGGCIPHDLRPVFYGCFEECGKFNSWTTRSNKTENGFLEFRNTWPTWIWGLMFFFYIYNSNAAVNCCGGFWIFFPIGVHHKNLVTWENRAPKDWQVASPLVM